jgi:hypothetical protein
MAGSLGALAAEGVSRQGKGGSHCINNTSLRMFVSRGAMDAAWKRVARASDWGSIAVQRLRLPDDKYLGLLSEQPLFLVARKCYGAGGGGATLAADLPPQAVILLFCTSDISQELPPPLGGGAV